MSLNLVVGTLVKEGMKMGSELFIKRSTAALPPGGGAPPPPPTIMPDPGFVDSVADVVAAQFGKMGFPMNEMVKAMIYKECDRRLAERMNDIHREGYEEGLRQTQLGGGLSETAPAPWILVLLGVAGAAAVMWVLGSVLRPAR